MPQTLERELIGDKTEAFGADPSSPARYEFRYKVIELPDLKTSHLDNLEINPEYPKELQPRIRDRAASKVQIGTMAANLNPRMLLHDSGFLDTGPIIVGKDNVVESGNGRALALRYAAAEYPSRYKAYLDLLKNNARKYGLTEEEIARFNRPILVRERLSDVNRIKFSAEANVGAVMRMSPYEQALQDSARLSDNVIGSLQIGEEQNIDAALRAKANEQIVSHFVSTLPANERAAISEAGGEINQQGLERLKLAIFAKTYTGEAGQRLVRIFGENVDPVIKSIENSVFQTLPDVAKAESLIAAGQRDKKLSLAGDLAEVMDTLAMLKQRHLSVKDYLSQKAMFEEKLTPNQKIILEHIDDIGHKPKMVREFLRDMASKIIESPPPGQGSMMGFEPISKEGLINGIITSQRKDQGLEPLRAAVKEAPAKEALAKEAAEVALAPRTSVQTGLPGMGKEAAQVKMLEEFGAGASEKKEPLIDIEAIKAKEAAKPLPGQKEMFPGKEAEAKAKKTSYGSRTEIPKAKKAESTPAEAQVIKETPKVAPAKIKAEVKAKGQTRVKYNRGNIESAIEAAKKLVQGKGYDMYIVPTALGLTLVPNKPPFWQKHIIVHPDGSTELIEAQAGPQARAAESKVKVTTKAAKSSPKLRSQSTGQVEIERVQARRSQRARDIDASKLAVNVVSIQDASPWLKRPNRYDISGIDAPRGSKVTVGPQRRGPGLIRSNGKMERQHRGTLKIGG